MLSTLGSLRPMLVSITEMNSAGDDLSTIAAHDTLLWRNSTTMPRSHSIPPTPPSSLTLVGLGVSDTTTHPSLLTICRLL